MPDSVESSEVMLEAALAALSGPSDALAVALEALPAPIYVTDAEGRLTFYNSACVALAGRKPALGEDRWCVTWKLYTLDGRPLPHEECPMAVAVKQGRAVRGIEAIAERPDGSRVRFLPYPTPVHDGHGTLTGAVNLLVDVTDSRRAADLRRQAERCRRLRNNIVDPAVFRALDTMADEYEAEADRLARLN